MATSSIFSSALNSTDFMQLLVAQLKCQDPEEPMSNSEMVTQMAQLSSVEGINNLNSSFKDIMSLQSLLGGAGIVGKSIDYYNNGAIYNGTVDSVVNNNGIISVFVNNTPVAFGDILRVQ